VGWELNDNLITNLYPVLPVKEFWKSTFDEVMTKFDDFLPRDARWLAGVSCPSVCLSVRLPVLEVEVSWSCRLGYLESNYNEQVAYNLRSLVPRHWRSGPRKIPQILRKIEMGGCLSKSLQYLWNGARLSYYGWLTGSRIHPFDWYRNQRPWMTLNGLPHNKLFFRVHHENLNGDRSIISATKM